MIEQSSPAEQAMKDVDVELERWYSGQQMQDATLAAISLISGRYKMESINAPR